MAIGLIIIGDEILSGKRPDKHFAKVLELLAARGMQLAWAEIIGDDRARITATLQRTFASEDIVFSCGGIGSTPDDHTRQCAAAALGVPLLLHPEAKVKIEERIADLAHEAGSTGKAPPLSSSDNMQRLRMGEFPQGANLIPNPYNKIPGFSVAHGAAGAHYFVPGFPVMAWPMIEWVLDTCYPHLCHQVARLEESVMVFGSVEAALTPLMEQIELAFPLVRVFSLPNVGDAQVARHIELGVKGDPAQVRAAFAEILLELDRRGLLYLPI